MTVQAVQRPVGAAQELPAVEVLEQEFAEKLKDGSIELPLLPVTAMRVFHAARKPEAAAPEVAEIVQGDQKLAGAVLRVANSAAHSPRNPIVTLQQAVTRLGLKVMAEIALGEAFRSSVYDDDNHFELMQRYWRESLGTAFWAKELARIRRENVETAYLCGLMHNVGKPLALRYLDDKVNGVSDPEAIRDVVEALARCSGPHLSEAWNMPAVVAAAIGWYHDYEEAPDFRNESAVVNGALLLAQWALDFEEPSQVESADGEVDEPSPPPEGEVYAYLNIYQDQKAALIDKREAIMLQVESYGGG